MSDDATVLWLDQGDARASHDEAGRALTEWARVRGVRLRSIEDAKPIHVDLSIADRVEKELDRAREALAATDADAAERALARVEAVLREHPELPQAAWLRAEVERTWSARWLRLEPRDEGRARAAWENAHALDGGRVAGIGETNFTPRSRVPTKIIIAGTPADHLTIRLDGAPLEQAQVSADQSAVYQVEVAPAEHHLLAMADGRVVFATWLAIAGAEPAPTRVTVAHDACAREQFVDVKRDDARVEASGVTCPHWVAAAEGQRRGSVLVARCERDVCGPLLEWRVERFGTSGPPQPLSPRGWPSWATWMLVGIGAATATSVALVATGIFEARPVEPRFIVGGARQE